jgi:osmoprotectant transport system substrate-binding protein
MPVAADLTFGGPAEFQEREQGQLGLESVYGVTIRNFDVLDDSGTATLDALLGHQVQVADIFTTDPDVAKYHLVELTDPRHLFSTGNIVPLVYRPGISSTTEGILNAISARLTMASLQAMDDEVFADPASVNAVARKWLVSVGLAGTGPA